MYRQVRGRQTGKSKFTKLGQLDRLDPRKSSKARRRRKKLNRRHRKHNVIYMFKRYMSALLLFFLIVAAGFFSGVRFVQADTTSQKTVMAMEPQPFQVTETEPAEENSVLEEVILQEESEFKTPLVVIDPGHGGEDDGCSQDGVTERDINLQIALLLAQKLEKIGVDVILTREDNETYLTLEERVQLAEENSADVFVSIHQNSYEGKDGSPEGIETWYNGENRDSERLARLVNMGAVRETGARERDLKDSQSLYVIRETTMPSCLIETSFLTNQKEREAVNSPEYQEKMAEGIAWGIKYYLYPKTMYLTFDDGPSEENTSTVLDILKEYDIKATFFVVGENVRKHPEVAKRIVEEGHTIGIHCNRHEYDEIYASVDSYLEDFKKAYDAVYEVTGVEVQLFRFPGGSVNAYNKDVYEEIIQKMTEEGFIYFDWNASLEDAVKKTAPEKLIQNAKESTLERKKVVMLAHDIIYNTTLCLEDLIRQFPEYKMEPLTSEVVPIQFVRD